MNKTGFLVNEGLYLKIACKECKKEGIASAFVLTSSELHILTTIKEKDFQLPANWTAMEWWSRRKVQEGYPQNENVIDSGFFCSQECLLKFFSKGDQNGK